VDGGGGKTEVVEVVIDEVGSLLELDEDQGARGRHGQKEVVEGFLFLVLVNPHDLLLVNETKGGQLWIYLLLDVDVSTSRAANGDVDVVGGEVLCSKLLKTLGEGSREEKVTMITIFIGVWPRLSNEEYAGYGVTYRHRP
jgi:hypothetical protein